MNIKRTKETYPKNTRCNVILKMFKTKTVKRQKKIQKRKRKKKHKVEKFKKKKDEHEKKKRYISKTFDLV